jgi:hypothetical protein
VLNETGFPFHGLALLRRRIVELVEEIAGCAFEVN